MFYYYNGRLRLTNRLFSVPVGEAPPGSAKISLKSLYEMFKDAKSQGLVSLQFLSALISIFFGEDVSLSKDTITELCKNLSLETLSRKQNTEFEKVSDLTAHINFKMKHSILSKLMIKTEPPKKKN